MGVVKQKMKMRRERPNIHIRRDAVFDNDEDVALDGGDSDSDGYLAEVVDETRSDTMKRKVLSGSVFTSCCDLVEEEQSLQTETFAKVMIIVLHKADHTFRSIVGLSGSRNKEKILKFKNNPKWDKLKTIH
ncbi:hypothetical protein Bca52824_008415 [Brassica carinata]|uniref:Uncharacterized protein n=1 Tax=Brassica carinata TaxID=52824 RepID=A0A8X8B8S7_BRACI|nr:hypothetical protein Bca52824_008415 [Brassica carinata]